MPPSTPTAPRDPVEFSVEDAMLNTWVEDTDVYLTLDPKERDARASERSGDQTDR